MNFLVNHSTTHTAIYKLQPVKLQGASTQWNEFPERQQFGNMRHQTHRKNLLLLHLFNKTFFYALKRKNNWNAHVSRPTLWEKSRNWHPP